MKYLDFNLVKTISITLYIPTNIDSLQNRVILCNVLMVNRCICQFAYSNLQFKYRSIDHY